LTANGTTPASPAVVMGRRRPLGWPPEATSAAGHRGDVRHGNAATIAAIVAQVL
jgi:hypothetical protein